MKLRGNRDRMKLQTRRCRTGLDRGNGLGEGHVGKENGQGGRGGHRLGEQHSAKEKSWVGAKKQRKTKLEGVTGVS